MNEDVDETPRLRGPIVCVARAGDSIDGAQHVHWVDIWPKISACDGAGRERMGSFLHDLGGLLIYLRRAAGHRIQCWGDDLFRSDIVDEDEHPGPKRVQRPHRGGKALSGCRQLLYLAPEYSFNQCIAIGEVAIKSARPNLRAASNFVQRRPWPVLREGFPRDL